MRRLVTFRRSLTARLALAFVAVAIASIAVLGGLALVSARREVAGLVARQRDRDATEITAALSAAYATSNGFADADLSAAFALAAAARADLVVLDVDGQPVATPPPAPDDMMAQMRSVMADGPGPLGPPRNTLVVVGGRRVGAARLRFPAAGLDAPERQVAAALSRNVVAGAVMAAVVALLVGLVVSRRLSRPVVALTDAARRLEAGERSVRTGMAGAPGQVGELATAFDQMADALDRHDELRRNLVADVAHELRTPLTILRASSEELVDGLAMPSPDRLSSLHDEVLRLGAVVADLETLASAEAAGLRLDRRTVALDVVAADAIESLRPRFREAGLTLVTDLGSVAVDGDPARLRQLVVNLLMNAVKYTPAGGTVTIGVAALVDLALLEVTDTGVGVPSDEVPHLFERFWRGSSGHGKAGSGIGLAIVAELAKVHGGRVEVETTPAQGSTFRVLLPCATGHSSPPTAAPLVGGDTDSAARVTG
ncbi:MAG: ATP-binding protein [Acidimicrobiales bacterium]